MSYTVQVPDFAGTLQRQEALNQQAQLSRLQMLAQTQAMKDADQFRSVAGEILPQLGTAQGEGRLTLLAKLAGGGGLQGAQMALPMLQQERENQIGDRLIASIYPGAASAVGAIPAAATAPAPALPAAPAAPAGGGDVRALNAEAARRRQEILDNPNLTPAQQGAALMEVSAWRAAAGGTPERAGGYRGDQPWAAGLPAPAGTVRPVSAAAPAQGATPAPAAAAPGADPSRAGLPSPQQLAMLLASGNRKAMEFAQRMAPLVARENPNWVSVTADGQVMLVNPQNPAQRVVIGRAGDAANREAAPFGSGAGGASLAFIEQLAPKVANGTASPEEVRRYLSAVTEYQQEKVSQDGTRIVPRLPAYAPGADVVVQQYGIGGAAPAAPQAQPAPQQAAGVQIPGTSAVAEPPALQPSPLPGAAGGVARPAPQPSAADRSKLRQIEMEAQGIRDALEGFRTARRNASALERGQAAAGMPTPLSTAWSNAALLAKGQALYDLGVLNGPDLDIIRRTLTDPATFRGFVTGQETVEAQIRAIETLLDQKLSSARVQYGGQQSAPAQARPAQTREVPPAGTVQQGYRFRGGDPSQRENWERVAQ